jgi:V/A-type H+-transporting ATPase subunit D
MRDVSPTRAALLDLQEERRALHEGHVFLDEKCLLLAGEMLRQLQRHAELEHRLLAAHEAAMDALRAALGRHGLGGLQVQPPLAQARAATATRTYSLMGVRLQDASWSAERDAPDPATVAPSPELRACRQAFLALAGAAAPLAAVSGNLERLSQEYRRSVRRARALQDVMLPELERDVAEIETRLEELEQQDALAMRRRAA